MKQITYLFGAGASANALPVSLKFRQELKSLHDTISITPFNESGLDSAKIEFADDCRWLTNQINGLSVDYLAKQFFDNQAEFPVNKANLRKLKMILSLAFNHWQRVKGIDPRYLDFFARLFRNGNFHIPDNVKILSWNYDSQFELAYGQYRQIPNHWEACGQQRESLKMCSKSYNFYSDSDFRILQLNGSSAEASNPRVMNLLSSYTDINSNEGLIRAYLALKDTAEPTLSFAFENKLGVSLSIVELAKRLAANTEVLVVIGYSFHDFNRDIDREILNAMLIELEKIIIQDDEHSIVEKRIRAILPESRVNEIRFDTENKGSFHLPHETFY